MRAALWAGSANGRPFVTSRPAPVPPAANYSLGVNGAYGLSHMDPPSGTGGCVYGATGGGREGEGESEWKEN